MTRLNCDYSRSYDVQLGAGLLRSQSAQLPELQNRRALVVTTPTVHRLHADAMSAWVESSGLTSADLLVLPLVEATKTMDSALAVCTESIRLGLGRKDVLVSFGGGVCSDVVSFSAGLIRRGIPSINLPTTLVGQVDAAIGVKNAVNHGQKKNYLGSYRPPHSVLVDPTLLATQPIDGLRCGLAEMIKIAVIRDFALFKLLQAEVPALLRTAFQHPSAVTVIGRAIELMLEELAGNPLEDKTYLRLVDFGHTISPVIEEMSGYAIAHGAAVAMDIALSAVLARQLGLISAAESIQILQLLRLAGLPLSCDLLTAELVDVAFRAATEHRAGHLNLVLPTMLGAATFIRNPTEIPASMVLAAITELQHFAEPARSGLVGRGSGAGLGSLGLGGDVHDDQAQPMRAAVG